MRKLVRNAAGRLVDRLADRITERVADRIVQRVTGSVVDGVRGPVEELVRREADRVIHATHEVEFRSRRDLLAAGERDAALAASKFVDRWMPTARVFHDPWSTLSYALEITPADGMALEFGVYTGQSLKMIEHYAKERDQEQMGRSAILKFEQKNKRGT